MLKRESVCRCLPLSDDGEFLKSVFPLLSVQRLTLGDEKVDEQGERMGYNL
jgi:hypothetical protein